VKGVRHLADLARPHGLALAVGTALMLGESAATLAVPWMGGLLAGSILSASGEGPGLQALLWVLLAVFGAQAALRFASGYLLEGVADRITAELKMRLYDHMQALPVGYFHQRRLGEALALLTNDVYAIGGFVSGTVVGVAPLLVTAAGAAWIMLGIRADLAAIVLVLVPLFYFLMKVVGRVIRPLSLRVQDEEANVVAIAQENLGLLPAIKAFTREADASRRFRGQVEHVLELSARQRRIQAALAPLVHFIAAAGIVLILALASSELLTGGMAPAALVSFILYALALARPVAGLADVYGHAQRARGALERVARVMAQPAEPMRGMSLPARVRGEIALHAVTFAYPGREPALHGIDLHIAAGESIALVGPNGAGKSTVGHLLMRLHDPASGRITIDGVDIAGASLSSVRSRIGVVPQHVMLFNAPVRDNIAFGLPDADDAQIEAAARAAGAHEFIVRLPQGYDTPVGDEGVRLSGGQRQRLALARALIKDPPILILDEATAMFDPEGEAQFLQACRDCFARRTVILITHRPASLRVADRIVHVRDGRIERIEEREARGLRLVGQD
jgi:subfamily B ATP-binding cassette protein MsbA